MNAAICYMVVAAAAVLTTIIFLAPTSPQVKGTTIALSLVVLICISLAVTKFHWLHIFGLFVEYFVCTRIISLIYKAFTKK